MKVLVFSGLASACLASRFGENVHNMANSLYNIARQGSDDLARNHSQMADTSDLRSNVEEIARTNGRGDAMMRNYDEQRHSELKAALANEERLWQQVLASRQRQQEQAQAQAQGAQDIKAGMNDRAKQHQVLQRQADAAEAAHANYVQGFAALQRNRSYNTHISKIIEPNGTILCLTPEQDAKLQAVVKNAYDLKYKTVVSKFIKKNPNGRQSNSAHVDKDGLTQKQKSEARAKATRAAQQERVMQIRTLRREAMEIQRKATIDELGGALSPRSLRENDKAAAQMLYGTRRRLTEAEREADRLSKKERLIEYHA